MSLRAIAGLLALPSFVAAADSPPAATTCEINVNVVVTDAGRKFAPPTPAQPVRYLLVNGGFRIEGARVEDVSKPEPTRILRLFVNALAQQGYAGTTKPEPPPPLVLVFHWGVMSPEIDSVREDGETTQAEFFNQKEMLNLVGGQTLEDIRLPSERNAVLEGAVEDRYFAIVTAFDYAAARQKKRVPLWQARMSVRSDHITLDEVLPALIAAAGPHYGRETVRPQLLHVPVTRRGSVEIGTPVVVPADPSRKK